MESKPITVNPLYLKYVGEIESNRYKALNGWPTGQKCAPELEPLIENFTEKCVTTCNSTGKIYVWSKIAMVSKIMLEFILHTSCYCFETDSTINGLQKIFDELELLVDEAASLDAEQSNGMYAKLDSILDLVIKIILECLAQRIK